MTDVDEVRITVGRRKPGQGLGGPDLDVGDLYVSNLHLSIAMTPDGLVIRDEGSTNGTTVNGVRLWGDRLLDQADVVGFGRQRMTVAELIDAIRNREQELNQ